MSIWTDILGVGASAASGGLFGLFGTAIGRVAGYFEKKQEFAFRLKEWEHETKLQELQMKARAQETEQEIALAGVQGSWAGLSASLQADASERESYRWVDAVRGLTRPFLTAGLCLCLAVIFFASGPGTERDSIVESITFAAVTAVVWWFGDRAPIKRAK